MSSWCQLLGYKTQACVEIKLVNRKWWTSLIPGLHLFSLNLRSRDLGCLNVETFVYMSPYCLFSMCRYIDDALDPFWIGFLKGILRPIWPCYTTFCLLSSASSCGPTCYPNLIPWHKSKHDGATQPQYVLHPSDRPCTHRFQLTCCRDGPSGVHSKEASSPEAPKKTQWRLRQHEDGLPGSAGALSETSGRWGSQRDLCSRLGPGHQPGY